VEIEISRLENEADVDLSFRSPRRRT
jgi:hypothetical protein